MPRGGTIWQALRMSDRVASFRFALNALTSLALVLAFVLVLALALALQSVNCNFSKL